MISPPMVIIVTGPCASGKTTTTQLMSNRLKAELINGDNVRNEMYPDIDFITEHPEKLKQVKSKIFALSEKNFTEGKTTITDYVILGEEYLMRFMDRFKDRLVIKVLFPEKQVTSNRDKERECWTSGPEMIEFLYTKFTKLQELIGIENYMDNGAQSPQETADALLNLIENNQKN